MRVLLDLKLCCLKTVRTGFCCHARFCNAVFPAACLDCFDQFCQFQSFTNRCEVYIFCCIQHTRRTWGAAAWSWRHFDGRGAVLHPFSQNRRLDQWRNTVTLRRTNVILSDLKSKARQNILTLFFFFGWEHFVESQCKNDFGKQITELTDTVLHGGWIKCNHLLNWTHSWLRQDSPHLYWGTGVPVQRCLSCGTSWPDTLHLSRTHLCTD